MRGVVKSGLPVKVWTPAPCSKDREIDKASTISYGGTIPECIFMSDNQDDEQSWGDSVVQLVKNASFKVKELLASSPPFQMFRAQDATTGKWFLLKSFHHNQTSGGTVMNSLLAASLRHHGRIRSQFVLTAVGQVSGDGYTVAYPYLDPDVWMPLSDEILLQSWAQLQEQLATIVDFIHLAGVVHADLKISNFLYSAGTSQGRLKLIDLDFAQLEHTRHSAIVFGTPLHIAPEVLANDRVVVQSDIYSLGMSLRLALSAKRSLLDGQARLCDALESLADDMTQEAWIRRPRFLSDALANHGLIDEQALGRINKMLLGLLSANKLSGVARRRKSRRELGSLLCTELNIVGLPSELLQALNALASVHLSVAVKIMRETVQLSRVHRHGEYFHLELEDSTLEYVLGQLDMASNDVRTYPVGNNGVTGIENIRQELACSRPLRALFSARLALKRLEERVAPEAEVAAWLEVIGNCLTDLNRHDEALLLYQQAEELVEPPNDLDLRLLAVQSAMRAGKIELALKMLSASYEESRFDPLSPIGLRLRRFEVFAAINQGRMDDAGSLINRLQADAHGAKDTEVMQVAQYLQGIIAWRRGDFPQAIEKCKEAINLSRRHELHAKGAPVLASLAMLSCEVGDYLRAITIGRQALRSAKETQQSGLLASTDMALCFAYARLADSRRTEHWLAQYLEDCHRFNSVQPTLGYYVLAGFCMLQGGQLDRAEVLLGMAANQRSGNTQSTHSLKVLLNQAELYLWRGSMREAKLHADQAQAMADSLRDSTAATEAHLFSILARGIDEPDAVPELVATAAELAKRGSVYSSMYSIYHILLAQGELPSELQPIARKLLATRGVRRAPVFAAVMWSSGAWDLPSVGGQNSIDQWKRAYQALVKGKQYYLAALTARRVAHLYLSRSLPLHAEKYLRQTHAHARALGNHYLEQLAENQLLDLVQPRATRSALIESLEGVTEILRELGDYRKALDQLLRFAVDQIGAERGLLLLVRKDKRRLQPLATYNCDDRSTQEITDFSSSLSFESVDNDTPLFIENAMEDSRTNQFRSVIAHNILSVACVPLHHDKEVLGVLYLDHHLLPGLFGHDDRKLMSAIANLLVVAITTAKGVRALVARTDDLSNELSFMGAGSALITRDVKMRDLLSKLPQIASSSASVLLLGESGTGKEILCNMIHAMSPRSREPLIKVNCAALAPTLIESELFGIARGVATGVAERQGRFEAADGGTLFLDEIADMSMDTQAKILRAVEYQQIERVGSNRSMQVDTRYIFATHQNLAELIAEKRFREDLFHRICTVTIRIPPLRERRGDIPILVDHFCELFSKGRRSPRFSSATLDAFISHPWPGNVRQLRSTVEFCCLFHAGEEVTAELLPPQFISHAAIVNGNEPVSAEAERERIAKAMLKFRGNRSKVAKHLGIHISSLRRRIEKYKID